MMVYFLFNMTLTETHIASTVSSNHFLVDALRSTSKRLERDDVEYQWGHMGQCNAGHLIQTLTGMSSFEIVDFVDLQLDE